MASQNGEMTSTEVVLVRRKDITEVSDSGLLLIGRIEAEPVHSQSMFLPLWIANLYSAVTSSIDQLEEALSLAQPNQHQLDEDYQVLITQYLEMLRYQNPLFDHAVAGIQQSQCAPVAERDQIGLDTTAFAIQVQGALTCLEQASSEAYEQLGQALVANTQQVNTLRNEFEVVHRQREEAAEARRHNQRTENNQLQEETRKPREDIAQSQEETAYLEYQRQQMAEDWKCHGLQARTGQEAVEGRRRQ